MNILRELQNKKLNQSKARQGLDFIKNSLESKNYQIDKSIKSFPVIRVDNILIASYKDKKVNFQGLFKEYYSDKIAHELEIIIKGKETGNGGHKFEQMVAYVLQKLGHSITNIKAIRWYPEVEERLIEIFSNLEQKDFKKIQDYQNRNSIGSDFVNKDFGISCKKDTKAIKHPSLFSVFSMALGKKRTDLVKDIQELQKDGKFNLDEARKFLGSEKELSQKIANKYFNLVKNCNGNVLQLYDFLVGKYRPWIIIKRASKVDFYKTEDWGEPTSYKFSLEKDKICITFDNGLKLSHRVKSAVSNKTYKELKGLYKEEWSILETPVGNN